MYKVAENQNDLSLFNHIVRRTYGKRGYDIGLPKEMDPGIERYIIHNETQEPIGTIELVRYRPETSTSENSFPFSHLPVIQENHHSIFEVQKLSILDEHQGDGYIKRMFVAMVDSARKNHTTCFIALLDYRLYRNLYHRFRFPIEKVGRRFFYKGHYVVPVVINVEKNIQQLTNLHIIDKPCLNT